MTIKARLLSVVVFMIAVIIAVITLHFFSFFALEEDATAVNLAGNMRFRSNKITLLLQDYLSAPSAAEQATVREGIDAEVSYVEKIMAGLRQGDPELGLKRRPTDDAAFLAQLAVVERKWLDYKAHVYEALSTGTDEAGMKELRSRCHDLVSEVHTAVGLLEKASMSKIDKDIKLEMSVLVVVGLVLAGIMLFVRKRVLRPLQRATELAARLGTGDLSARMDSPALLSGNDEIAMLGRTLNDMATRLQDLYDTLERKVRDRTEELMATNQELVASQSELKLNYESLEKLHDRLKATQEALIQAEKCSSIGTLAAGVAHEINNPLAAVIGYAEGLIRDIEKGQFDGERALMALQKLCDAGWRCARIVTALKAYSRQGDVVMSPENINYLVEDALNLTAMQLREKNIKVRKDLCDRLSDQLVECDGGKIRQVVVNLLMNAREAMPSQGGEITVRSMTQNGSAVVEVADTGSGMPKEVLSKVFDPFYTTKEVGHGMGLGLAVARGIIDCHQGDISVDSEPGKGTRVTFTIPYVKKAQDPPRQSPDKAPGLGRYDDSTGPMGYKGF